MATGYATTPLRPVSGSSRAADTMRSRQIQATRGHVPHQAGISAKGYHTDIRPRMKMPSDPETLARTYPAAMSAETFDFNEGDPIVAWRIPASKTGTGDLVPACFVACNGLRLGDAPTSIALQKSLFFVGASKSFHSPQGNLSTSGKKNHDIEGIGILTAGTVTISNVYAKTIHIGDQLRWRLPTLAEAKRLAELVPSTAETTGRVRIIIEPFQPHDVLRYFRASFSMILRRSNNLNRAFRAISAASNAEERRRITLGDETLQLAYAAEKNAAVFGVRVTEALAIRNIVRVNTPEVLKEDAAKDALLAKLLEYFKQNEARNEGDRETVALRNMNHRGGRLPGYDYPDVPVATAGRTADERRQNVRRDVIEAYLDFSGASNAKVTDATLPSSELLKEEFEENRSWFTDGSKTMFEFSKKGKILKNAGDTVEGEIVRDKMKQVTDAIFLARMMGVVGGWKATNVVHDVLCSVYGDYLPNNQSALMYTTGKSLGTGYGTRLTENQKGFLAEFHEVVREAHPNYLAAVSDHVRAFNDTKIGRATSSLEGNPEVEQFLDVALVK